MQKKHPSFNAFTSCQKGNSSTLFFWGFLFFSILIFSSPHKLFAAYSVDAPIANPETVTADTTTEVLVTVQIVRASTDPEVVDQGVYLSRVNPVTGAHISLLGTMHDDGLDGDTLADDDIFALSVEINPLLEESIGLRVSVPFRGVVRRKVSPITIISVVPPVVEPEENENSGFIHGIVRNSLTDNPLEGAEVTLRGVTGEVQTTPDGKFTFPTPDEGDFVVEIKKEGFTRVQSKISVDSKRDRALDPVFLTPLDSAVTPIGSGGGTHTSSDGEVVVIFPAGALSETIDVQATRFRAGNHLPGPLPEQSHFTYAVNFQPDGITFNTPVTYRIKNDLNLPAGTPVPVGIYNETTVQWEAMNMAEVTTDGEWVEGQIEHFTSIDCNLPVFLSRFAVSPVLGSDDLFYGKDKQNSIKCPGCEIDMFDGALRTDITLPSVRTLGENRALTLRYDSSQAYPRVLAGSRSKVPDNITLSPDTTSAVFEFQGVREAVSYTGSLDESILRHLFPAQNARGEFLETGIYKLHYEPSNDYGLRYATADFFGGPPRDELTTVSPYLVSFVTPVTRKMALVNEKDSPFGAGWSLEGLERIHEQEDGTLLLTNGTGSALPFTPVSRAAGLTAQLGQDPESPFAVVLGNTPGKRFAFDPQGNIYLASTGDTTIKKITPQGAVSDFAAVNGSGTAVAVGPDGFIYAAEFPSKIWKISSDGSSRTEFFVHPQIITDLTFDAAGNLYASGSSLEGGRLFRIDSNGSGEELFQVIGGLTGVAVDASGNIFAAETPVTGGPVGSEQTFGSARILRRLADGFLSTYAVGMKEPQGITLDPDGNLIVMDTGLNQILRVTPDRITEPFVQGDNFDRTGVPVGGSAGVFHMADAAFSPAGDLFVINRFFTPQGTLVSTVSKIVSTSKYLPPGGDFSEIQKNTDGSFTRKMKDGIVKDFNAEGFLTKVTDRNANEIEYIYDSGNRLSQIRDEAGRFTVFSYETSGKLVSILDPAGRTTLFDINAGNQLVEVIFPDQSQKQFSYDARGLLVSETDPRGNTKEFIYDDQGLIAEEILPEVQVLENGDIVTQEIRREFQPEYGSAISNIIPAGSGNPENPAQSFNPEDALGIFEDALARTALFLSNGSGAPTRVIDALTQESTFARDSLTTRALEIRQPNGLLSQFQYDDLGNTTQISNTSFLNPSFPGNTTNLTYEPEFSLIREIHNPVGQKTRFSYDVKGNLTHVADPLGQAGPNITEFSYNSQGLVTQVQDAAGNFTNFAYDTTGNLVSVIDPLTKTTLLDYDNAGNVIETQDPLGRITRYEYDAMNRLVKVIDPDLKETLYGYDLSGNLTQVTDANLNVTHFQYDALDRLIKTTDPESGETHFVYDGVGNLVRTLDRKGQQIDFNYDALNRLLEKLTPEGTTTYAYDAADNLIQASDSDSKVVFQYDPLSRLTQAITGDSGLSQPVTTLNYEYDGAGQRTKMTSPQGQTLYDYIENLSGLFGIRGNLAKLTNPFGEIFNFTYDSLSRRTKLTRPNNTETLFTYNPRSELLTLENRIISPQSVFSSFAYSYDDAGNRNTMTTVRSALAAASPLTYLYDDLDRLTQATNPLTGNPDETFTYDPVGNRLRSIGQSTDSVFNAANRLESDANFNYQYDANGNLTSKTHKITNETTQYTYDSENRLIQINLPAGGGAANYRYDALGRRIEKEIPGSLTRYVYDGEDILLEYDGTNTLKRYYTHGVGVDEPLAVRDIAANQSYFYNTDGLGSITDITDAAGNVSQSYLYDSFGNIIQQAGTFGNFYSYTGREYDAESGLYYYRARYYAPSIGRFLQEDPIGFESGDENFYVYVSNNPANYTDPDGEFALPLSGTRFVTSPPFSPAPSGLLGGQQNDCAPGNLSLPKSGEVLLKGEKDKKRKDLKEHRKKRPSTEEKHQQGLERKLRDKRGGEKGDARRPYRK